MVRWAPLTRHLRDDGRDRIKLTYAEIEAIVGGPLPESATAHRPQFWSNAVDGGMSRHWMGAGYRTALRGVPSDVILFVRHDDSATAEASLVRLAPTERDAAAPTMAAEAVADVLLVGCVKSKTTDARPARDLYTSELFRKRRTFAEAAGPPWVVLSAEYGAVDPYEVIEPYDRFLEGEPAAYQHEWGERVVDQLEELFGPLAGMTFELHASRAYGDPLEPLLRSRGATMIRPLDGLRFGEHLQWYGKQAHKLATAVGTGVVSREGSTASAPSTTEGPGRQAVGLGAQSDVPTSGLARRITRAFAGGELDLSARPGAPTVGWEGMPEVRAAHRVRGLGANDAEVRVFLTLISAMDRARDADRLWERGADAFAQSPGLFDPYAVVQHGFVDLLDALRSAGVSQRHTIDAAAWRTICESLDDRDAAPAIRRVLLDGQGDARELITAVQARTAKGTDRFPLLRGPKIRAMWIRILAYPGEARIGSLEVLPVAVDVQVRKVTENLGVTATRDRPLEAVRETIQQAWADDVAAHGTDGPAPIADTAAALDPALWFYGKWGCTFCERGKHAQPIHHVCQGCRLLN